MTAATSFTRTAQTGVENTTIKTKFTIPLLTRKDTKSLKVQTVSINDLLEEHNAPRDIDYISIDTEGSEFSILKELDLNKYNVSIFTVEHNFIEEKKNKVKDLLEKNNYLRVFEKISAFDGWYIKQDVPRLNNIFK